MRTSIQRSLKGLLVAGALAFSSVGAVTPGQALGGGPVSGGLIALSGGLDVSSGSQRPPPPISTPSTSNAVSHHRTHSARSALPR
jgi:hypothetical protein